MCEWFNVVNCRSEHRSALRWGLGANRWLLGGLLASNLLQVAVVYFRPLGAFFGTVPLGVREVLEVGVVGSAVLWVEELRKWFARRRRAH